MATEDAATTGTPDPNDTDAQATATGGTSETDGRNAEQEADANRQKEFLALKAKAERVNALEAENRALKERKEPSPAAPGVEDRQSRIQRLRQQAQGYAEAGDATSALLLEQQAEIEDLKTGLYGFAQLQDIPKSEHDKVVEHYNNNRHRLGDLKAARAELREKELDAENEELRKQIALANKKPDPEVRNAPSTGGRSNADIARTTRDMTEGQFDAEATRIRESQGELAYLKFMGGAPDKFKR